MNAPTILKEILDQKKLEVKKLLANITIDQLEKLAQEASPVRGFTASLQNKIASQQPAVIAEIKKASPSKGIIREDFHPAAIARSYEGAGAACLSILTDENFFLGHNDYLVAARSACQLPVIRKDFIIDHAQIAEARAIGADCILLIVSALDSTQLRDLYTYAKSLSLDVLIEVHDHKELLVALELDCSLVGINNRNLHTFETDLNATFTLLKHINKNTIVVTESGIHSRQDVEIMQEHGVNSFLVGEAFMSATEPGEKLKTLFF